MSAPVYLDYNATTPVEPEVADAIEPYLREHFGNPSSSHIYLAQPSTVEIAKMAVLNPLSGCCILYSCQSRNRVTEAFRFSSCWMLDQSGNGPPTPGYGRSVETRPVPESPHLVPPLPAS